MTGIIVVVGLIVVGVVAGMFVSRSAKAAGGCACGCNSPKKKESHPHHHAHGEKCCEKH